MWNAVCHYPTARPTKSSPHWSYWITVLISVVIQCVVFFKLQTTTTNKLNINIPTSHCVHIQRLLKEVGVAVCRRVVSQFTYCHSWTVTIRTSMVTECRREHSNTDHRRGTAKVSEVRPLCLQLNLTVTTEINHFAKFKYRRNENQLAAVWPLLLVWHHSYLSTL